ncbi:MAG: phosphotransferase [Desulfatiglans sp.]|jgi:aminoglycoside/choline kinase family phosphotransferase|nr:phosphotransferase [Thermodesulfobacteriota bacterium]MEE4353469.1 phosphotransferase [Desulfatiglans sp.]
MDPSFRKFIVRFFRDIGVKADPIEITLLQGDGSKRIFWRVSQGDTHTSIIAMSNLPTDSISRRENLAYLRIGRHLRTKKTPLPEIFRYDLDQGWFIMEDMGQTSLQDLLSSKEDAFPVYKEVLGHLFRLQTDGADGFDPSWCCQTETYDRLVMRRYESDYFREAFLCGYLGLNKNWDELEGPFNHLADMASLAPNPFFLHRDFQSRNIMVSEGKIAFLDWQGGRLGPLGYDVASLIIDPYTALSRRQQRELYKTYLSLLEGFDTQATDAFKSTFLYLAIQRNLQILGAFAYLSRFMGKSYFEAYIPPALSTLRDLLQLIDDPRLTPLTHLVVQLGNKSRLL